LPLSGNAKDEIESGSIRMNCAEVIREIPLYSYGEVSSQIEEEIESHLSDCAACRQELARHRLFLERLDERPQVADMALLTACRADLRRELAGEETKRPSHSWSGWNWFGWNWADSLRGFSRLHIPLRIPVGAMALVALGWFGARIVPEKFGGIRAGLGPMFSTVQSVEPAAPGKVRIAVDEVQRRVVSGDMEDPKIQGMLMNALREESDPNVRAESIGVLQNGADSEEVRQALVDAVSHDPDAGVRLKAIEGLKPYAGDAAVRKTLANVLLKDDNAGVRVQAIDLLTVHHDDSIVGVLQDVMQKEDDSYIRTRCRNLLEAMKASVGTY
jgi:HEAT repeats/Putative zinc-finger